MYPNLDPFLSFSTPVQKQVTTHYQYPRAERRGVTLLLRIRKGSWFNRCPVLGITWLSFTSRNGVSTSNLAKTASYYVLSRSLFIKTVVRRPVTRQRTVNNGGTVLSMRSVPMTAHPTMEYVMSLLSNNGIATKEWCFLRGPCRDVISRRVSVM
jgi:hypothetical protein